jgi:hypothetical protein
VLDTVALEEAHKATRQHASDSVNEEKARRIAEADAATAEKNWRA